MLEKTTRVNQLFDFYHLLLTEKQKLYVELYYHEDYSLGEIAELSNVSRQAVYDNIKRTEQLFETYESKLKLLEKFQCRLELLGELEELIISDENINSAKEKINQIRKLD